MVPMSPSTLDSTLPLEIISRRSVLFLLLTMPLIFGATHPFIQGLYTLFILLGAGGWWIFVGSNPNLKTSRRRHFSREKRVPAPVPISEPVVRRNNIWLLAIVLLLIYIVFTAIPLPLGMLHWLSPVRARNLEVVNTLAGAGIKFAPLSYSGLLTFKQGLFYIALLLYFFSLRKLLHRNSEFMLQVITVIVGVAFFEALYGLLQVMNSSLGVLWLPSSLGASGVARGTIIYRNQYATFLNMGWPLAMAMAALNIKKRPPALFLFAAGMIILAVLFSLSRGGIIAFLGIAAMLAVTMPFSRRNKVRALFLLIIFLVFYGALLGGYGELLLRFSDFKSGVEGRFSIWCMSLPMLFDHPLTGIGLESYVKLSPIYLKNESAFIIFERAHNEFLEFAIELGWPAMLLFCGCLLSGLLAYGRRLKQRREAIVGIAAFAGICGFFIHGLTDFGWQLPANCVYCVTLLALLAAELDKKPEKMIE